MPILVLLCLVVFGLLGNYGLFAESGPPLALHLRSQGQFPALEDVASGLTRLTDGAHFDIHPGDALGDFQPGAYQCGKTIVFIRSDDSVAAQAMSLVGLPIIGRMTKDQQELAATHGLGLNEYALPVYVWQLADGYQWPWVTDASYFGGLAGICWRITVDGKPFAYDFASRCYVDNVHASIPIINTPPSRTAHGVRLGDLVATSEVSGILVRDLGQAGSLDPADEVVTACLVKGRREQVRIERLGDLVGQQPIDLFTRDRPRGAGRVTSNSNPLNQMSLTRQLVALGGMLALCTIMLMRYRKLRRQSAARDAQFNPIRPL